MTVVIYLNKENSSYNLSVSDIAGEAVEVRLDEILASELFTATREYIQDNYPSLSDQQLDIVTDRTLALEDSYGYDEDDAIEQAIKEEEIV